MSKRKANTPKARARKPAPLVTPAEREAAREIAAHISAILNHPLCPRDVYNHVADSLTCFIPAEVADSPAYVEQMMLGHFADDRRAAGRARKGAR